MSIKTVLLFLCVLSLISCEKSSNGSVTDYIPLPPTDLWADSPLGSKRIDLGWTDRSTNESGFKIQMKVGYNGTFSDIGSTGKDVNRFSYNLSPGTYYFRVYSYNSSGNSATYSNEFMGYPR